MRPEHAHCAVRRSGNMTNVATQNNNSEAGGSGVLPADKPTWSLELESD